MADIVAALVALLAAEASVTDLAGTRIFGGELPTDQAEFMPRDALVIAPSGGTSLTEGSFLEADTQRFDLFSYGPTPGSAAALSRIAATALRRARRSVHAGVLIHWVRHAGGFSIGRDPLTAWPRAIQSFQVFHSLEEV